MRSLLFLCLCSLGCLPAESLFQVCETNDDCAGECRNGRCLDNAESLDGVSGEGGSASSSSEMRDSGAREGTTDSDRQDVEDAATSGADAGTNEMNDAEDPDAGHETQSNDIGVETDGALADTGDTDEADTENDDGGLGEDSS